MKITRSQLKRIIEETSSPESEWAAKDDIKDAIQMLENEEDTNGVLFYVIERLYTALEKMDPHGEYIR